MMSDSRSCWCGHNDAICAPGRDNAAPGNGTPGAKNKIIMSQTAPSQ